MRSVTVWADKVHDREGNQQCIYDLAFKPDGTQLIAAAGNRVLVYETAGGELITSLKGHKDTVYCVAYSRDGKHFASGGADKHVIIWNDELQGLLKYSQEDAIQCLAFNPMTGHLASCAASGFAFWQLSASPKSYRVNSRICSASWTNDGQYIALGLFNGNISIRNLNGDEKVSISRPGGQPVWALSWNPSKTEKTDILAVCDWNQTMSFYMLSGRQIFKERKLDYDPCCLSYFTQGEFLVAGGSDKQASLYTREGVKLTTIGEQEGWVWSAAVRPRQNYVAVGCHDGTIALHQLIFSTVHGLYRDQYACRRDMTDVVVQDLSAQNEFRLRCKDLVKKIAIYKNMLAVQLPNQINIYELITDEHGNTKGKVSHKIKKKFECNLLVVCAKNVILCQERRLQCLAFTGEKDREWVMDSLIRYIKVTGGPAGREGLLVGLKSGQIMKIFVDNPFPVQLIKQNTPVRCLDLSPHRNRLAVVDDKNTCLVYDLKTKELLFMEPNANSVSFNSQREDMLCFSGNGMLHIKAADFPIHQQKLQGFVVGFNGSNIYCLHVYAMNSVDVPQSHSMYQYLKKGMFPEAYGVACLGVTEADWRALAVDALEGLSFDIAKKSFCRVRDLRYLELLQSIDERQRRGEDDEDEFLAEIYAHQGRFDEAASLFKKTGNIRKALDMFCDLRQFDRAKRILPSGDAESAKYLMKRQADGIRGEEDPSLAIDILAAAGEEDQAVDIMGQNGMHQKLIEKARELNKAETDTLERIAGWLTKLEQVPLAAEVYQKLGDDKGLVRLYVSCNRWDEAFALADRLPAFKQEIYVPYAQWLAENDRFEEAQAAFRQAGMEEKAVEVLEVLTYNAVVESRFDSAAYYYWQLSNSILYQMQQDLGEVEVDSPAAEPNPAMLQRYHDYQLKADMYYAYHSIQLYIEEPFTAHLPESLFNIARFLLQALQHVSPPGISKVSTLFALAKQSRNLGAYKMARIAYEKLQTLKVPDSFREHIDLGCITIRSKPFNDREDVLPLCYRCSTPNPLIGGKRFKKCVACGQPFVFSKYTYEVLPLVEFAVEDDIGLSEAKRLIEKDTGSSAAGATGGDSEVMTMGNEMDGFDSFMDQLLQFEPGDATQGLVTCDRDTLAQMPSQEVFIQELPAPLTPRYYRNVLPEVAISQCPTTNQFFHADDYELLKLQHGAWPFCQASKDGSSASTKKVAGQSIGSSSA